MNNIKGDITTAKRGYVVHQCNAMGKMRSGVAKSIKSAWPDVYDAYKDVYDTQGERLFIGQAIPAKITDELFVFNLIGQENYGNDGKLYTSYAALEVSLTTMFKRIDTEGHFSAPKILHTPLMGCGLGGGSWAKVSKIITKTTPKGWKINLWEL